MDTTKASNPKAVWQQDGGRVVLELSGLWTCEGGALEVTGYEDGSWPERFSAEGVAGFDSRLPAYLMRCLRERGEKGEADFAGLPEDLRGLMELALKVPEQSEAKGRGEGFSGLAHLGTKVKEIWTSGLSVMEFLGEVILSTGRFFVGKARFRRSDFWKTVQECGVEALPIVALISLLIGMILAFVGNVQLANFGAQIFVADLVGIAMVREMGVIMTAIIVSGRTGAAFAANLGSMNANEEIDALRTFGFNSFDFLVLPRVFALVLMLPILTIYSNVIGIFGGMLVAWAGGVSPKLFWNELLTAINPSNASLGVIKSIFFGIAIAIAGCMQGMNAGKSSAAVGEATTRAVVISITAIVVLDSLFAAIFTILDI